MKLRKLRIAWSVAWGVVAVLLCVVCAASYLRSDALNVRLPGSHAIQIGSAIGRLQLVEFTIPQIPPIVPARVWTPAEIEAERERIGSTQVCNSSSIPFKIDMRKPARRINKKP